MNESLLPDDPKLTAYALGELTGDDRAAVEAALRENPALRAVVDEVRLTVSQLEAALADEPIMGTARAGAAIPAAGKIHGPGIPHSSRPESRVAPPSTRRKHEHVYDRTPARGKLLRFPQFYYVIGGLAAACFLFLVALNRPEYEAKQTRARIAAEKSVRERRTIVAIPLSAPAETASAAVLPENTITSDAGGAVVLTQPAFIDGSLSLVEQSRREPLPMRTKDWESGQAPVVNETAGAASTTSVASISSPARETDTTAATVPSVEPAISPGSGAGGSSSLATASAPRTAAAAGAAVAANSANSATFGVAPDDEIVRLDTFVVRGDHLYAFTALSGMNRVEETTRGMPEPRVRPRAPAAAQFVRNTETYATTTDNDFVRVAKHQVSTLSVDVDTASYANVRRMIDHGLLPPRNAVRVEELLNYFPYRYASPVAPRRGEAPPFAASLEVADAPWAPTHRLVRIGLKGREVSTVERGPANLVFLIDVSASMADANKLPLVKESLRLLLGRLRPDDHVAIVVYAGASGLALPSTPVLKQRQILSALDQLQSGGATNGAMGIHLAYDVAKANFEPAGINRVILCTDGDFNVGTTSDVELVQLIEDKAHSGVFLTVLGFGMGNYKDATLEKLANKGNGNYGYIDTRREAEKLLVEQVNGMLVTIAKDVKIQVEFNPTKVSSYRLIGYENRQLRKEDFSNDKVDAGEIGAGHSVTALYEVVPYGAEDRVVDPGFENLKYQAKGAVSSRLEMPGSQPETPSNELLTVKVRYKKPDGLISRGLEFPLVDGGASFANASADFQFAAAVAQFGMILRDSPHRGAGTLGDVIAWAATAAAKPANDPGGYRGEFIDLVRKTQRLLR